MKHTQFDIYDVHLYFKYFLKNLIWAVGQVVQESING